MHQIVSNDQAIRRLQYRSVSDSENLQGTVDVIDLDDKQSLVVVTLETESGNLDETTTSTAASLAELKELVETAGPDEIEFHRSSAG